MISRWLTRFALSCGSLGLAVLCAIPAWGAERISFYTPFGQFNINVKDLELFAKEGKITKSFSFYTNRLSPQQQQELRDLLNETIPIDKVATYQFTHSNLGKRFLQELTSIATNSPTTSFYFLRAALVNAASNSEGLSILSVLREYDAQTIFLDVSRIEEAINEASSLFSRRDAAIAAIKQAAQPSTPINAPNLASPGAYQWVKQNVTFTHPNSQVRIRAAVYIPQGLEAPAPVVVIAPGLNSSISDFEYLAQHLASYGFGVTTISFPESGARRISNYLAGFDTQPVPQEWVEQPKDVTALLDELSQNPRWSKQLDLQPVGVIGQSLGGYTALAIAGAQIDWTTFQQACASEGKLIFNLSLLWQCTGVQSANPDTQLRDQRVAAVIAANPVTNPIFGQTGMSKIPVPVMLLAGSEDIFAPPVVEQILPFTWIQETDKYLAIVENGNHFSFIGGDQSGNLLLPPDLLDTDQPLARDYLKALSVVFFETYIGDRPEFAQYLSESYGESLSQPSLPLLLMKNLTPAQVETITKP